MIRPLKEPLRKRLRPGCAGAVLLAVGLFGWVIMLVLACQDHRVFTQYVQTPCKIISKQLEVKTDDEGGRQYRATLIFEYQVGGRTFRCEGYDRLHLWNSWEGGETEVLNQFQPGQTYPCWYDPANPGQALLARRISWVYLVALIPLALTVIGLVCVAKAVRNLRRAPPSPEKEAYQQQAPLAYLAIPVDIKTEPGQVLAVRLQGDGPTTRTWGCLVLLAVGGAAFAGLLAGPWLAGPVLVAGLVFGFLHGRKVNEAVLEVSSARLAPAEGFEFWTRARGRARLNGCSVWLVCEERATYTQGTTTATDTKRVWEEQLAAHPAVDLKAVFGCELRGSGTVPADAAPSFKAPNNEIAWFLAVKFDIPAWPDVERRFPLLVGAPGLALGEEHGTSDGRGAD